MTLRTLDLFSGIGGFALGFGQTGAFELAAYCEIDERAAAVFARHFPGVPNLRDVKEVTRDAVEPLGRIDVITGGFPCQDLSVAGRRAGLAGERSGLWFEYHRILDELKPQWVVIENVSGLLSSNGGADFAIVLRGLVECGYGVAYRILDAQYFGLAQRRRRVFIVGSLGDGRAAQVLFEREGMFGHPPARGTAREGTAGGAEGGAGSASYRMTAFGQYADDDGASAVKARDHKDATDLVVMGVDAGSGADLSPSLTGEGHDGSEDGRGRKAFAVASVPPTLQKESYSPTKTSTGQALDWCVVAAFDERNITSAANRTRVEPGLPANTLHAEGLSVVSFTQNTRDEVRLIGGDGDIAGALGAEEGMHQRNYITTGAVRRLTPTECTRLQGFPDDWQEITDADETQAHAREVLHGMWREAGKEHREGRRLGIAFALLTPEILLAGVYGGWVSWEMAYESAGASREIQGTDAWPEGFMQALRQAWQAGSSPYRRESFEQFARQLGRPVQELPLEGAQARAYLLSSRVWAQASQEWTLRHAQPAPEEGNTPRLSDSARYRQLGNAVAVPVARWIAARIAEVAR